MKNYRNLSSKIELVQKATDLCDAAALFGLFENPSNPENGRENVLLLQELVATDPIISKLPFHQIVDGYQRLLSVAPELSGQKEVIRDFLRQAGVPQSIDPSQAKKLIEENTRLFKQRQLQKEVERFTLGAKRVGDREMCNKCDNIFEMASGSPFPHNGSQTTWQYARSYDRIHLCDGTHTYSFKGQLGNRDTELEKIPDVPLPDIYANSTSKGKAQVHRSDPNCIYFTLHDGTVNPTYTLKHGRGTKWQAIPKARKGGPVKSTTGPAKKR